MSSGQESSPSAGGRRTRGAQADFAATRWTIVLSAADRQAGSGAARAMDELVRAYWFPLYAFARRTGQTAHAAEDAVQGFFACVLEKEYLAQVDRSRGRFRSFLLAAFKHFMSKQRHWMHAKKRGGGQAALPLDALTADARYTVEPADHMTPERLFERQWALAVLDRALRRLRAEYDQAGKAKLYAALECCLTAGAGTEKIDYARAAGELNMTEGAVRVAAHRIRRRYRDVLTGEIAQTVDSPDEVAEEIAYLMNCL